MYGSMTTADTRLRAVGDPRGEDLLLDGELEAGVDRQAEVLARRPGSVDDGGVRDRRDRRRRVWAWTIRGWPASCVLVVLLDAVLADALAVDEAEELRGERRVRAPPPSWG